MKHLFHVALCATLILSACRHPKNEPIPEYQPAPGFVSIVDGHFAIDGEPWFPLMLNYKAFMSFEGEKCEVVPAPWYLQGNMRQHFDTIASWGFNAVRVCLDVLPNDADTAAMFQATRRMVQTADSAGLRVMLLLKPPFDNHWRAYAAGLMRRLADMPALWAYDLMNEPLYFDPVDKRDKREAVVLSREWLRLVRQNAPHQLFTIATAEPIEVFEWDPSMLAVDFIEMHTYHPLRVQAEMWWYAHYGGKPWMVGETGLPADGDSVPLAAQAQFMAETYRYALSLGAIGYGWWEFQDCPEGVNFEAQYTGLRNREGVRKPAASTVRTLFDEGLSRETCDLPPVNYNNMLAYGNVCLTGRVVDGQGRPIEGAVVRGWNDDWSTGVNAFTTGEGRYRLVSNDVCTHFEISAPGYSRAKFDKRPNYPPNLPLPEREREYQQIPVMGWGADGTVLPSVDDGKFAAPDAVEASIGEVKLKRI